ncbi:MAG: ribbon-helix-helix domain-containing protein [Rhizobiaceae bacterium]|nr:ribbon-helix-helix domain-containing protein [Rhizobiaceae bacterium]
MSAVIKRSISIRGHRTSFSIEQPFFDALHDIAAARDCSLAALIAEIDETRSRETNLSSALRLFVLSTFRTELDRRARS